jgi:hypothetical protein
MKPFKTAAIALLLSLIPAVSLVAHHSLANHDTSTAVRVKGKVVQIHLINPHSIVYVEEKRDDGSVRRWAVEGPSVTQIKRQGLENLFKPGDILDVCGYVPKEAVMWQIQSPDSTVASLAGRLITAEVLVLPDGRQQSWGDYGIHKCFGPEFHDQHSK